MTAVQAAISNTNRYFCFISGKETMKLVLRSIAVLSLTALAPIAPSIAQTAGQQVVDTTGAAVGNVVRVDGTRGPGDVLDEVEDLFAGALAEGPCAETTEERRALLRWANDEAVCQARAYLARKTAEGKTAREARRAHKRHLANRVIRRMWADERRRTAPPQLAA